MQLETHTLLAQSNTQNVEVLDDNYCSLDSGSIAIVKTCNLHICTHCVKLHLGEMVNVLFKLHLGDMVIQVCILYLLQLVVSHLQTPHLRMNGTGAVGTSVVLVQCM